MSRPSWDEYFMAIAKVASIRSPDEETKVGCVIVERNRILATGFNGHPAGINGLPTKRPDKYKHIIHAEHNALASLDRKPTQGTLYCTHLPCEHCASLIAFYGIKRVVWNSFTHSQRSSSLIEQLLLEGGCKCERSGSQCKSESAPTP